MPRISDDNTILLSEEVLTGAHLQAGDDLSIVVDGRGRLIVERRSSGDRRAIPRGTADRRSLAATGDGQYPRDYLLVASVVRERMRGRVLAG